MEVICLFGETKKKETLAMSILFLAYVTYGERIALFMEKELLFSLENCIIIKNRRLQVVRVLALTIELYLFSHDLHTTLCFMSSLIVLVKLLLYILKHK